MTSREASREIYAPGTEFHIGSIELVANTGTYLDTPYHRYPEGPDLSGVPLEAIADLPGLVVRAEGRARWAWTGSRDTTCAGRPCCIHTGWDRHFGTDGLLRRPPLPRPEAAEWLVERARRSSGSTP